MFSFSKRRKMASDLNILDLPDLVLYNICSFITNPFDLIHFGNTCTRLRRISSSPSLWWPIAFCWCKGLWIYMEINPIEDDPREWLLRVLKEFTILPTGTELTCIFSNGEEWQRVESHKFRCIFGMLRLAYTRKKDDHPAVLYEQWLYDIGLYRRVNVQMEFSAQNFEFSKDSIIQLTHLGQAAERDLRRRKQPNKDPKYYIKRIATAEQKWMYDLFPDGPHGSICPLLMCPFQNAVTNEISGLQGLAVSLSVVLAECLKREYKSLYLPLKDVLIIIKTFCTYFIQEVMNILPEMESKLGSLSLKSVVISLSEDESSFNIERLQNVLAIYGIKFSCKDVIRELSMYLQKYDGIDMIVDKLRSKLRHAMFDEINEVLFSENMKNNVVTRINLTDSDLIGGDNSKQEMSSAAFVSEKGVLISWHLTGRMRF